MNTLMHVVYVRHWGRLYMCNIGEVMLFTTFMHMLWFNEIVFLLGIGALIYHMP